MRLIQNSFIGGEISPSLFGRHDMEAYFHAAKSLANFQVMKTGGLRKRQGTQLLWRIATGETTAIRTFAYFYSRTEWAFVLFYRKPNDSTLYYRFCKKDGAAGAERSVSADVADAANLEDAHIRQVGDTIFYAHRAATAAMGKVSYPSGTIAWSKAAHATTPEMPADFTSVVADGFTTSEGYQRSKRVYCLIGVKDGVYSPVREHTCNDIWLPWTVGATVTLTFTPDWTVYDYYIVGYKAAGSWMVLDTFYDGDDCTLVDDNMVSAELAGVTEAITVGDEARPFGVDVVDVWQQRLVMASSEDKPFTLWFSRTGDVRNFHASRPQTSDSAFEVTIATLSAARILHSVTSRWFLLFTEDGEYTVESGDRSGFAYSTVAIRRTTNIGAHDRIEPVVTDSQVVFVAADARTIYSLNYSLEQDSIVPQNISFLASHMTEGDAIRRIVWAKFPEPTLYALLASGDMLAITFLPEQKVCAFSRVRFANAELECVDITTCGAVREESGLETSTEVLLTFRKRGDNSANYVERMRVPSFGDVQDAGKAKCRDHCGYTAADYSALGGDPETDVEAEVVTVRPESPDFNSLGLGKNIFGCTLRLNRSGAVAIRPDADVDEAGSAVQPESAPEVDGESVRLVTKDVKILPRANNNTDGRMRIRSADRWPCEILSVLYNIEVPAAEGGD